MKKIILILAICLSTYGCIPLLVGEAIYGAQKSNQNKTARLKVYNRYKMDMEKLNLKREAKGLKPKEIQDFEDWSHENS